MGTNSVTDSDGRPQPVAESFDDFVFVSYRPPARQGSSETEPPASDAVDGAPGATGAGIDSVRRQFDSTWVVWGPTDPGRTDADPEPTGASVGPVGGESEPTDDAESRSDASRSRLVRPLRRRGFTDDLTEMDAARYANRALWPLCHSAVYRAEFDADHRRAFREVNERFGEEVARRADGDTTVWFRDHRFALAPAVVREREPDALLMHSIDVPWPSPDAFATCPRGSRLLEGLLANDLIALPHPRHRAQFLQCVDRELGSASIDWAEGRVHYDGTVTTVESFPVNVDVDAVTRTVAERGEGVGRAFRETHGIDADTTLAVGSDRLDYTSGVLERLDALEALFESRPDLRGELTYVQLARETGDTVPACQRVREDVEAGIRTLDERFGTGEWSPVVPAPAAVSDAERYALYRESDIGVVAPLRGGRNRLAEEYVAAQTEDDGVLLLGPAAGAAEALSDHAVEFDPYDTSSAVEALDRALEMPSGERQTRMRAMRRNLSATDSDPWPALLGAADAVRSGRRQAR